MSDFEQSLACSSNMIFALLKIMGRRYNMIMLRNLGILVIDQLTLMGNVGLLTPQS